MSLGANVILRRQDTSEPVRGWRLSLRLDNQRNLESADFVVDTIQTILRKQKFAYQLETKITTQAVNEKGEPGNYIWIIISLQRQETIEESLTR